MLLLTRHPGQSFYIGEDIKVTVVKHARDVFQIGISAPPEIVILREELVGKPDHKGQVCLEKTRILGKSEL